MTVNSRWLKLAGALVLVACGLFLGSAAHANGMRCATKLVSTGDSTFDVRSLCGPPDAAQHRTDKRIVRQQVTVPCPNGHPGRCTAMIEDIIEVAIDEWTYDFGPQRFVQYLTFEQDKLVRVQSGGYGHKPN